MNTQTNGSWVGLAAGAALAPLAGLGSLLRRSRLFHPNGVVLRGVAQVASDAEPAERALGERLAGPVFVRFSGAWWKRREWPDLLGCALRFSAGSELSLVPGADDQDLLLATIQNPLTLLLAPLSTRVSDYLDNDYFGVSPFSAAPLGRIKLRLAPLSVAPPGATRADRLSAALEHAPIALSLQARLDRLGAPYRRVARIELHERFALDPRGLRFDPFASGRGLAPVGAVNAMRLLTYSASRHARALSARPDHAR